MKKLILLFLIAVLSTSAYAQYATLSEEGNYHKVSIPVSKGWNLLPADSFSYWDIHSDSESMIQNLKALFIYLPIQKRYVKAMGGFNDADMAEAQQNKDFLWLSAEWYYITSPGNLVFRFPKSLPETMDYKLSQGWNLFAVPPQFTDGSLGWGDCNIDKIYLWDSSNQKWSLWEGTPSKTAADKFIEEADDLLGIGVVVKAQSNCKLGPVEDNTIPSVPQLPG